MSGRERAGANLYVFRDARQAVSARALLRDLGLAARAVSTRFSVRDAEEALLRAGELEGLIADAGGPHASTAALITDRIADVRVGMRASIPDVPVDLVDDLPVSVRPSPPESFAYYALDPQSFVRLSRDLAVPSGAAAVIGIRTIGVTLSAVVAAALRARGVRAHRMTVRPHGHPYARSLTLDSTGAAWAEDLRHRAAEFFIVDEGPGMSGSSFLAVGEALVRAGVDPRRITFLGTRTVDPRALLADDAERRFQAFAGLIAAPPSAPPDGASVDISAGAWRARTWRDEGRWPATWPAIERAKYITADGQSVLKFEGLGRWGAAVCARAEEIARAGFGPPILDMGAGYAAYPRIDGQPLERSDRSRAIVDRLADYCAFRASAFPAKDADTKDLRTMMRWNSEVLLGFPVDAKLPVVRPVITDARLHPHEWIRRKDGGLSKVDAAAHGDDHLFPGPADIAWDLACAIVEWDLDDGARSAFLDRYARASGDDARGRLPGYLAAYTLAQWARAEMALGAHAGTDEGARWQRECQRLRAATSRHVERATP